MRVAAGGNGEYDADWDEHYAPPPPPKLKRAAQAPKKIATVGGAGADRWMCKGACVRCGDSVWSNEPRVRVGRGYAHLRCPRAFDYYATTAEAAFRPRITDVGAGSPLQRLDSVQIDADGFASPEPLQRVPRVYSFEAMTSRSL